MSHPDPRPDDGARPAEPGSAALHYEQLRRGEQLVDAFLAGRRARASLEADELRLLGRVGELIGDAAQLTPEDEPARRSRRIEIARRSLIAEMAVATGLSEWTVTRLLGEATDLCHRFGAGVDALGRGEITRQHLAVIHEAGIRIDDDDAVAAYLDAALERARQTTPGRLGPVVKILAERHLDSTLDQRHADAAQARRLQVIDQPDSRATLIATMPAVLAHGIYDRIDQQARSVIDARVHGDDDATDDDDPDDARGDATGDDDAPDTRTIDQVRADVFIDLLLTGVPASDDALGAIRATVQVTVPVLTLLGHSSEPCLLAGHGPIDTDTARTLAAGADGWERVLTDPATGEVLEVDRYRPSRSMNRFLKARDERCRFPGCRRRAHRCDIDHTDDHASGGKTSICNLAHLCRRHHTLKHASDWTVKQLPGGVLVWTSPSGRKHTDRPEPTVRFQPEAHILALRTPTEPPGGQHPPLDDDDDFPF